MSDPSYVITLSCPDRIGIVAAFSNFLATHGCNILDSAQFDDPNGRFFMRTTVASTQGVTLEQLWAEFEPIRVQYQMEAHFHDQREKMRTVVMVSRFGHCLNDLLFRWKIGALPIEIAAIVSNHKDFQTLAEQSGVPFYYLPVTPETKAAQEKKLKEIVDQQNVELIVLARYMQVLSADICADYSARIINIHHSFLPSFKGALPYQQAYARGVKLIGATAHYVTHDLDEGPIIEQSVERVRHDVSAEDYIVVGRDVESLVLSRAVKWHAEHRVLLNGNRTVVFQ